MQVLMIAGGTGGHIFPALAVARALQQNGVRVDWLGSRVGLECELVGDEFPMHLISVKGVRGKGLLTKLLSPIRLFRAVLQAYRIIKSLNPDVIVGMGGFASGPGGLAAWLMRKPLVIQEQNAIAGVTNRVLAKFAKKIFQAFPDSFPKNITAETIGNPVRDDIFRMSSPGERLHGRSGPLHLLILGGSQGARPLNQLMIELVRKTKHLDRIALWQQTGKLDYTNVVSAYHDSPVEAKIEIFIHDIVEAYNWADIVLCRAGALTVSELTAAGLGSILVPFPYAVDNHQYYNGRYLVDAGAAVLVPQPELTIDRLESLIDDFLQDRSSLVTMAQNARQLAKPDAVQKVVNACTELA